MTEVVRDVTERLERILVEEDKMHPIGCASWRAEADVAVDMATELLAGQAAEIEEFQQIEDLRWAADMRAIQRWREANPGNELVLPDHADLVVWLLEKIEALSRAGDFRALQHAVEGEP